MKLENYKPTSRQVLFREVHETVTKGGILIPEKGFSMTTSSTMFEQNDKLHVYDRAGRYIVVKVGKDVTDIVEGEQIFLTQGIRPTPIELDGEEHLFQVMEMQIIGHGKE